jgi:hypothetical protein
MHRTTASGAARVGTLTVATLALIAAAVGPAAAASPNAEARAKAEHERIVRYWTAERIADAQPRDFERAPNGTIQPRAKPSKPPGGGGGGGSTVTGASWAGEGPVVTKTGKVLFTMGGSNYVCSGTVVADKGSMPNHSLVLSAAHCIYDEAADVFATNWIFVPSFDTSPTFTCAQASLGCWTATGLAVHQEWADEESLTTRATTYDFGIAVVGGGGKTGTTTQLDSAVGGGYTVSTSAINAGTTVHAFGYPAAQRYKGNDLTYCAGPTFTDQYNDDATWGIACNMTGGSSGGPWFKDFASAGASGTVTSLNSYGYSGLSNMYGPKFNANTQAVIDAAAANLTGNSKAP